VIRDSGGHARCLPQGLMHAAEVVVAKMQRYSGSQVLDLLGKCVRQSRESTAHHAKREVLPFDVRRADVYLCWKLQRSVRTLPATGSHAFPQLSTEKSQFFVTDNLY